MEKKYYHDTYFQKITRLAEEYRLEEAFKEFQKYIKVYPKDVYTMLMHLLRLIV